MKTRKLIFAAAIALLVAVSMLVSTRVGDASKGGNANAGTTASVLAEAGITPTTCAPNPPKPSGLTPGFGTVVSKQAANLSWNTYYCAKNYRVTVRRDSSVGAIVLQTTITTPPVKVVNLQNGHAYYWQVQTCYTVRNCTKSDWNMFIVFF